MFTRVLMLLVISFCCSLTQFLYNFKRDFFRLLAFTASIPKKFGCCGGSTRMLWRYACLRTRSSGQWTIVWFIQQKSNILAFCDPVRICQDFLPRDACLDQIFCVLNQVRLPPIDAVRADYC